jgi:sucrose phosphorylase
VGSSPSSLLSIHGADAGFDPIDHTQIDPCWAVGRYQSIGAGIGSDGRLDCESRSSASPQFMDYSEKGDASIYSGMFLTMDSIFPNGATEADLLAVYRPRPGLLFLMLLVER